MTRKASPADGAHNVALLVIDVQRGLFDKPTPIYHAAQLLDNLDVLIQGTRAAGVPVFFIQHASAAGLPEGSDAWRLHERLQPLPREPVVGKRHGNAFEDTLLREDLDKLHVQTVVICGLVTHGCVKATCQGALELGYQVVLVSDGHSSYSKDAGKLITEWNDKLGKAGALLLATGELDFRRL